MTTVSRQKKRMISALGKSGPCNPKEWKEPSVDLSARPLGSVRVRLHIAFKKAKELEKTVGATPQSSGGTSRQVLNNVVRCRNRYLGGGDKKESKLVDDNVLELIVNMNDCFVEGHRILESIAICSKPIAELYTSFAASFGYLEKGATTRIKEQRDSFLAKLEALEGYLPKLQEHATAVQNKVKDLFGVVEQHATEHLSKTKRGKAVCRMLELHNSVQASFVPTATALGVQAGGAVGGGIGLGVGVLAAGLAWAVSGGNRDFRQSIAQLRIDCDHILDLIRSIQALKHAAQDIHDELKLLLGHMKQVTPFSEKFTTMTQKPEVAAIIWLRIHRAVMVYKDELANLVQGSIREPVQSPSSEDPEPMTVDNPLFSNHNQRF